MASRADEQLAVIDSQGLDCGCAVSQVESCKRIGTDHSSHDLATLLQCAEQGPVHFALEDGAEQSKRARAVSGHINRLRSSL